jgi:hypothetical protein
MKPIVCIGPPFPFRNPAAHGTKHCQRKVPAAPVLKVNSIVTWSWLVAHGATWQGLVALSAMPF